MRDTNQNTYIQFQTWSQRYYVIQSNLFYDMQSKFQNKLVLPKKTCEVHFIASLNILWRIGPLLSSGSINSDRY
jgi:hypothetical protein